MSAKHTFVQSSSISVHIVEIAHDTYICSKGSISDNVIIINHEEKAPIKKKHHLVKYNSTIEMLHLQMAELLEHSPILNES